MKRTIKLAADLINTSYLNLKYQVIILLSCSNLQHMKHFLFNGKFYDQIDGVATGSPLAPVLTNIFLRHKKFWIKTFRGLHHPTFEDMLFFSVFNNSFEAKELFHYINTRHPKIKFTICRLKLIKSFLF